MNFSVFRDISRTGLWVCGLSFWLKTKSLTVSTFSSTGTARSATAWPPVNCACLPQLFQQLINTTLCLAFLRKFVCQPLCCVRLQMETFYQNLVLVVEYHVDCWQTLRWCLLWRISDATDWSQKWISKRKVTWNICKQYGIAVLNTENIKICGWITKLEVIKMQFVCVFFHVCRKFEYLIFQGSVATCLRWDG